METYEFTLVVRGDCTAPKVADLLFGAFDDDPGISTAGELSYIDLSVEGFSHGQAISKALRQFFEARVGLTPVDVLVDWLMTLEHMSELLPFGYERLRQLQRGVQGPGEFPRPMLTNNKRIQVWNWRDVKRWLMQNGLVERRDIVGDPNTGDSVEALRAALRVGDAEAFADLEPEVQSFVIDYTNRQPA